MTIIKYTGQIDISEIKRCYVNIIIKAKCPECKGDVKCDLNDSYLSYPEVPSTDSAPFYCEHCDEYLDVEIQILSADLTIQYDAEKIKKQ